MRTATTLLAALFLVACDGGGPPAPDMASANLKWYSTCGDPVCREHRDAGTPRCTTEAEGAACTVAAKECDPVNMCNSYLRCTDKDPKQQVGGCPISRRRFKEDIAYLTPAELAQRYEELRALRLASYRYRDADPKAPRRLGFLIDDAPGAAAVDPERDMIDLYGYMSVAVAALQVQAQKIEALEREVAQLRGGAGDGDKKDRKDKKALRPAPSGPRGS